MKIYNEIISQFNETTQQWEDVYEDSFEYDGEMLLMMPQECGIVGDVYNDGVYEDEASKLQLLLSGDQHGGCSHIEYLSPNGDWQLDSSNDCSYVWEGINYAYSKRVVCEDDLSIVMWDTDTDSSPSGTGTPGHSLCGLPEIGTLQFALLDITGNGTITTADWMELLQYEGNQNNYVLESSYTEYVSPCVGLYVGDECCVQVDVGTPSLQVISESPITLSGLSSTDIDEGPGGDIPDCLGSGIIDNCLYYKWTIFESSPSAMDDIVNSLLGESYDACEGCTDNWKLCNEYPCVLGEVLYGTSGVLIPSAPFVPYGGVDAINAINGGYFVDIDFLLTVEDPEGASSQDTIKVTVVGSVNHAPIITFGNTFFDEHDGLEYRIPFALTDVDNNYEHGLPSIDQTLVLSDLSAVSSDISGVVQDGNHIKVTFIDRVLVDYNQVKEYVISYQYSDGIETLSESVTLTIEDVNEPPAGTLIITNAQGEITNTFIENESMTVNLTITDIDEGDWEDFTVDGLVVDSPDDAAPFAPDYYPFDINDGTLSGDIWTHSFTTPLPNVPMGETLMWILDHRFNDNFHDEDNKGILISVASTDSPTTSYTVSKNNIEGFDIHNEYALPGDEITITLNTTLAINTEFEAGFPKWERNTIEMDVPTETALNTDDIVTVVVDDTDGLDLPSGGSMEYTFLIPDNNTRAQCFVNQPIDLLISLEDNYGSTFQLIIRIKTKCPPLLSAPNQNVTEGELNCNESDACDNYLTSRCCYTTAEFTVMHDESYDDCENLYNSVLVILSGNEHVQNILPQGFLTNQPADGVNHICYGQVTLTYDEQHNSTNGGNSEISVEIYDEESELSSTINFTFDIYSSVDQPVSQISSTPGVNGTVISTPDNRIDLDELQSYTVYGDTSYSYECNSWFDEEYNFTTVENIYTIQNNGCLSTQYWYWTNGDGSLAEDGIPPEPAPQVWSASWDELIALGTYTFTAPIITGTSPVYRVLNLIVLDYFYQFYSNQPPQSNPNYPSIPEIVTALDYDLWAQVGVPHALSQVEFQFNPISSPAWTEGCTNDIGKQYHDSAVTLGNGCSTTGGTGNNMYTWTQTKGLEVSTDLAQDASTVPQAITVPHIPSNLTCTQLEYSEDLMSWAISTHGGDELDWDNHENYHYRATCLRADGTYEFKPIVQMSSVGPSFNYDAANGIGWGDAACWGSLGVNDTPPTPLEFNITVTDSSTSSNSRNESFGVYTDIVVTNPVDEIITLSKLEDDYPTTIDVRWDDYMSTVYRAKIQNITSGQTYGDGWVIKDGSGNVLTNGEVFTNSDLNITVPHVSLLNLSLELTENWHNNNSTVSDSFEVYLYNNIAGGNDGRVTKTIKYIVKVEAVNDPPIAVITTS